MRPKCLNCTSHLGFWRRIFLISYNLNKRKLSCKNCGKESGYSYRSEFAFIQFLAVSAFFISLGQVNIILALVGLFVVLLVIPATFLIKDKKEVADLETKLNQLDKVNHEQDAPSNGG